MKTIIQLALLAVVSMRAAEPLDLWRLARNHTLTHRFSTLFTAHDVRDFLSSDQGIADAIAWCKQTGITKVYLETYRSRYRAELKSLVHARDRFRRAGFRVSGEITTTRIGKISTGWKLISCYTSQKTQGELRSIVEYTAQIFDEIVLNDFFYTDCTCNECDSARKEQLVRIRTKSFPVASQSWEDYRSELMVQLARSHVIGAAKRINPNCRLIVKYPRWYERYRERGYDVIRETKDFDRIWAGAETRDPDTRDGRLQYGAFFLQRWLRGIGGRKTGGGWFDSTDTTVPTYIEQARQTILADARETMLASYGMLHRNFGPEDVAAFRTQIPELLEVAAQVRKRRATGIAAYKPVASFPEDEAYVFDHAGMIGLPLAPSHVFPGQSKAVFLSIHAWADTRLRTELSDYFKTGRPVLLTDGLARRFSGKLSLGREQVQVLRIGGNPASLLKLPPRQLDQLRAAMLAPFGITLKAPARVALYLFTDGSWVLENFNNSRVSVTLNGEQMLIGPRAWVLHWK